MDFEQELIKFKLLLGIEELDNGTFNEIEFNDELQEIYTQSFGENVTPLFLN